MKCNIKRAQVMQEQKVIKCCICGEELIVREGNNPFPVREWSAIGTDKNRCCHKCNSEIVIPARMASRYAKSQGKFDEFCNTLKNSSYEDLVECFVSSAKSN